MGNRESLLAGAKLCLLEKGYARTTARDITGAAGVSLAAIRYHFGSTEALLNAALIEATEAWGVELERALTGGDEIPTDPLERFEVIWSRIVATFTAHRGLWAVTFEMMAQADHAPELRQFLAEAQEQGRAGLASLFLQIEPSGEAGALGTFHQALLIGVMGQLLIAPETAASGRDLARAVRMTAGVSA